MTRTQDIFYTDLVKTQKGKDSFKPLFCNSQFYIQNQKNFALIQNYLNQSFLNLNEIQTVTIWSIILCLLRRPDDWFAGIRQQPIINGHCVAINTHFSFFELTQLCNIKWPSKVPQHIQTIDFINSIKIKPLADILQKSFAHAYFQTYPIKILDYEPTPFELLEIQSQGKRIITFKDDYQNWPQQLFGHRDPLSFWLHDFIHAEHFFSNPSLFQQQIGFYNFILNSLKTPCWDQDHESDNFKKAFSYLISDMNSHPLHLLKTYKALIDIHFQSEASMIWLKIIQSSHPQKFVVDAMQNVNTAYFSSDDCDVSLQYLNSLGA